MLKLLSALVAFAFVAAPVRAELSPETMEAVIELVCSEEKSITAPEQHLWEERCNYRFRSNGAVVWFFYQTITDFREERCMVPRPWCEPPYRVIMVSVRWPHIDEPNYEEFLIDEGIRGAVNFGVVQSAVRNDLRFDQGEPSTMTREGRLARGLGHQTYWQSRYLELVEILLERNGVAPDLQVSELTGFAQ